MLFKLLVKVIESQERSKYRQVLDKIVLLKLYRIITK